MEHWVGWTSVSKQYGGEAAPRHIPYRSMTDSTYDSADTGQLCDKTGERYSIGLKTMKKLDKVKTRSMFPERIQAVQKVIHKKMTSATSDCALAIVNA